MQTVQNNGTFNRLRQKYLLLADETKREKSKPEENNQDSEAKVVDYSQEVLKNNSIEAEGKSEREEEEDKSESSKGSDHEEDKIQDNPQEEKESDKMLKNKRLEYIMKELQEEKKKRQELEVMIHELLSKTTSSQFQLNNLKINEKKV
jgi:hypothetical protein